MPAKRAPSTIIPDPFILDASTLAWLEKRHPQVDPEVAVERFTFWACEYQYSNWQRTFQNFLTREADNNKLGPMLKKSPAPKDKGELLKDRAKTAGFRMPNKGETFSDYESALSMFEKRNTSSVMSLVHGAMPSRLSNA